MTKIVDFDAYRSERQKEPVQLRIGGKLYDLPPSLPAAVALDLIRMKQDLASEDDVPMNLLEDMGTSVFGATLFRQILDENAVGLDELGDLIQQVITVYSGGKAEEADAEGN